MVKITPKSLLKKSSEVIDFDDINITKYNFSVDDLDNGKSKNHTLLKKILNSCSSCQISDAYSSISNRNCVISDLKSINNKIVYGKIFTAKTNTDDWGTSLMAIDNAEKGEVLFIYTYGNPASVWGELTSTCAREKGISGTILYGWTRDIDTIVDFDYPVFAIDYLPNAGNALGLGEISVELKINEDIIKPGDFVFADQNGVVVIPKELFHETMVATFKIKINENHIIKELKKGRVLSEIIGLNR